MKQIKQLFIFVVLLALLISAFALPVSAVYYPGNDDNIYLVRGSDVLYEIPIGDATDWSTLCESLGQQDYSFAFDTDSVSIVTADYEYRIYDYQAQPVAPTSSIIGGASYYLSDEVTLNLGFTNEGLDPSICFDFSFPDLCFYLIEYAHHGVELFNSELGTAQFVILDDDTIALDLDCPVYTGYSGLYYLKKSYDDSALLNQPADTIEWGATHYLVRICGGSHADSSWHTVKAATCTEAGEEHYLCNVCLKLQDVRSVPALDHDLDFWGNCKNCDYNKILDSIGGSNTGSSGGSSGSGSGSGSDSGGTADEKPWYEQLLDWAKGLFDSGEDDAKNPLDSILTIVFLIGGVILFVVLLPLLQVIVEGLVFFIKTIGSFFTDAISFAKSKAKRAKARK